jgi:hypothetical protein
VWHFIKHRPSSAHVPSVGVHGDEPIGHELVCAESTQEREGVELPGDERGKARTGCGEGLEERRDCDLVG